MLRVNDWGSSDNEGWKDRSWNHVNSFYFSGQSVDDGKI